MAVNRMQARQSVIASNDSPEEFVRRKKHAMKQERITAERWHKVWGEPTEP
jgi:hypothetical protein